MRETVYSFPAGLGGNAVISDCCPNPQLLPHLLRLDVLVTLVEAWEAKHYPMDLPDPVAAINTKGP